jgi:hypothetical protein
VLYDYPNENFEVFLIAPAAGDIVLQNSLYRFVPATCDGIENTVG